MIPKFYIPLKQRFGMMVFILLILVIHNIDTVYDKIAGPSEEEEINMIKDILSQNAIKKKQEADAPKSNLDISNLPMFDPNIASKKQLIEYGLSKYAIDNLEKYRSKGGRFKVKEDLLKIYGIDTSLIEDIQDKLKLPPKSSDTYKKKDFSKVQSFASNTSSEDSNISNQVNKEMKNEKAHDQLPLFDPNTATKSELLKQGISSYSADNLLKYRSKGGKIYKPKDITKIYGIDSSVFNMLSPRINIIETSKVTDTFNSSFVNTDTTSFLKEVSQKIRTKKKLEPIQELNINTATQEQLIALRGIGPVISKGIVEYRSKLGGYHKLEQLLEVYGITEENYNSLIEHLFVEGEIEKFYPAGTSFKNLVRHPYIDYETTKTLKSFSIMNYSEELQKLIEQGDIDERLLPYIYTSDPETVTIKN